jgi:hypothetical protein
MSTLERIEKIESVVQSLKRTVEDMSARSIGVEQSATAVAKTLAALSKVLVDKKVITGDDVLDRLRTQEEKQQKDQIEQLVAAGLLVVEDTVTEGSVVIVSQCLVNAEESVEISAYSAVDLTSPYMPEEQKQQFIGLKEGGIIKGEGIEGDTEKEEQIKVLSIYRPQEVNGQNDESESQADTPTASTGK